MHGKADFVRINITNTGDIALIDPQSSYSLKEMMKEHARKGNTVFFSTHVLEVAERLCDKVAIINRGRIVFFGTLEELKQLHPQCDSLEALFMEVIAHA